ncbi:hypothetical protein ARMGADRAFT_1092180 [Armillaria gallica]|uniref:Uncharacterized protein n=1 Tax=Armillaria gallica TaxID=47427 RepID=A0A2H3CUR4_ARMGA|nr:hypothetical protein ARMGADRAFT_1092180 [Armillaria gallica]
MFLLDQDDRILTRDNTIGRLGGIEGSLRSDLDLRLQHPRWQWLPDLVRSPHSTLFTDLKRILPQDDVSSSDQPIPEYSPSKDDYKDSSLTSNSIAEPDFAPTRYIVVPRAGSRERDNKGVDETVLSGGLVEMTGDIPKHASLI